MSGINIPQNCERCGKPIAETHWFCGLCWKEIRKEKEEEV